MRCTAFANSQSICKPGLSQLVHVREHQRFFKRVVVLLEDPRLLEEISVFHNVVDVANESKLLTPLGSMDRDRSWIFVTFVCTA